MASSVYWYGHVLRREDCHVWRMALNLYVEYKGGKGGHYDTEDAG